MAKMRRSVCCVWFENSFTTKFFLPLPFFLYDRLSSTFCTSPTNIFNTIVSCTAPAPITVMFTNIGSKQVRSRLLYTHVSTNITAVQVAHVQWKRNNMPSIDCRSGSSGGGGYSV